MIINKMSINDLFLLTAADNKHKAGKQEKEQLVSQQDHKKPNEHHNKSEDDDKDANEKIYSLGDVLKINSESIAPNKQELTKLFEVFIEFILISNEILWIKDFLLKTKIDPNNSEKSSGRELIGIIQEIFAEFKDIIVKNAKPNKKIQELILDMAKNTTRSVVNMVPHIEEKLSKKEVEGILKILKDRQTFFLQFGKGFETSIKKMQIEELFLHLLANHTSLTNRAMLHLIFYNVQTKTGGEDLGQLIEQFIGSTLAKSGQKTFVSLQDKDVIVIKEVMPNTFFFFKRLELLATEAMIIYNAVKSNKKIQGLLTKALEHQSILAAGKKTAEELLPTFILVYVLMAHEDKFVSI